MVAKAYVDQLERSNALPVDRVIAIRDTIADAEKSHMNKKDVSRLNSLSSNLQDESTSTKDAAVVTRLHNLAEILKHPLA